MYARLRLCLSRSQFAVLAMVPAFAREAAKAEERRVELEHAERMLGPLEPVPEALDGFARFDLLIGGRPYRLAHRDVKPDDVFRQQYAGEPTSQHPIDCECGASGCRSAVRGICPPGIF